MCLIEEKMALSLFTFIGAILGAAIGGIFTYRTTIKRYFIERQVHNYSEFLYLIDVLIRNVQGEPPKRVKEDFGSYNEKFMHRADLVKLATKNISIINKINDCVLYKDDKNKLINIKEELLMLMREELHGKNV